MEAIINCKDVKIKRKNIDAVAGISDILKSLDKSSIKKVYILYSSDAISRYLDKKQNNKATIIPIKNSTIISDIKFLSKINELIDYYKIKDDLLIIDGCYKTNPDFSGVLNYFNAIKKPIVLLKHENKSAISSKTEFVLDENGFIKTVVYKPENPKSLLTSGGFYLIPKDALFLIKTIAGKKTNISVDLFFKHLSKKRKIRGIIKQ